VAQRLLVYDKSINQSNVAFISAAIAFPNTQFSDYNFPPTACGKVVPL
jgi:hypothetical protein